MRVLNRCHETQPGGGQRRWKIEGPSLLGESLVRLVGGLAVFHKSRLAADEEGAVRCDVLEDPRGASGAWRHHNGIIEQGHARCAHVQTVVPVVDAGGALRLVALQEASERLGDLKGNMDAIRLCLEGADYIRALDATAWL